MLIWILIFFTRPHKVSISLLMANLLYCIQNYPLSIQQWKNILSLSQTSTCRRNVFSFQSTLRCLCAAVSLTLLPVGDHSCHCVLSFSCYLFPSPQEVAPVLLGILHVPRPLKRLSRWTLTWLPLITGFVFATLSVSRGYALYKGQPNTSLQITCYH